MSRLPRAARRAHRPLDRGRSASPSTASASRRSRATPSPPRSSPPASARSRAASSTTAGAGLLCCAGQCPNCLVAVDGAPGVRACTEPVREGMVVEHLNASPSLEHDVMARDRRRRRPVHAAGLLLQDLHPPAAAVAAVREGAAPRGRPGQAARLPGRARVAHRVPPPPRRRARRRRRRSPGCAPRSPPPRRAPTSCWPTRAPSPAGARSPRAPTSARASWPSRRATPASRSSPRPRRWAASTGSSPSGRAPRCTRSARAPARLRHRRRSSSRSSSPATTCPGVMLSGGARRLAALYAVAPGTRAVVATTSDRGLEAALALQAAGVAGGRRRRPARDPGAAAARAAARRRRGARGLDRARGRGAQGRAGA